MNTVKVVPLDVHIQIVDKRGNLRRCVVCSKPATNGGRRSAPSGIGEIEDGRCDRHPAYTLRYHPPEEYRDGT